MSNGTRRRDFIETARVLLMDGTGKFVEVFGVHHVAQPSFWRRLNERAGKCYEVGWEIHYELIDLPEQKMCVKSRIKQWIDELATTPFREKLEQAGVVDQNSYLHLPPGSKNIDISVHEYYGDQRYSLLLSFVNSCWFGLRMKCMSPRQALRLLVIYASSQSLKTRNDAVVIDRRNAVAVEAAIATPSSVLMIWGADHVSGIVELLENRGFSQLSQSWNPVYRAA